MSNSPSKPIEGLFAVIVAVYKPWTQLVASLLSVDSFASGSRYSEISV